MIYYLLSTFFSALSNTLTVFFAGQGFWPSINKHSASDVILHLNIINLFTYFIIYSIKKSRDQIHFSIKKTFTDRRELGQVFLFALPVFSAYYKIVLAGYIDFSHIAITSMIKPLIVGFLAIVFLKEKLNKKSIKFAALAMIGFYISNLKKMGVISNEIISLSSYVLIASFGDITRRFYCRRRTEDMQALGVECIMFASYSLIILTYKGTFSLKILFHPLTLLLSIIIFLHHFCLVHGVRKAFSVVALEFVNLSKPVFTMFLSALLMHDFPDKFKIMGAVIIAVSVIGFSSIERYTKNTKQPIKT